MSIAADIGWYHSEGVLVQVLGGISHTPRCIDPAILD